MEPVYAEKGVLGLGINLFVDTQQTRADFGLTSLFANERLVESNSDILIVVELQAVNPYLLENPKRKAELVYFRRAAYRTIRLFYTCFWYLFQRSRTHEGGTYSSGRSRRFRGLHAV